MNFYNEDAVKNMSATEILNSIKYFFKDEKDVILNLDYVKERLKENLLLECNQGDIYRNFGEVFKIINVVEFFNIIDSQKIIDFYKELSSKDFPSDVYKYKMGDSFAIEEMERKINDSKYRKMNEYKLFVCLMEKSFPSVIDFILEDDELFKEVMSVSDNMFSCYANLDYERMVKVIYKMEKLDFIKNKIGLNIISTFDSNYQKKLLEENFDSATFVKIIPYFKKDVISYFFENDKKARYLFKKFNIKNLVSNGIKFNREILLQDAFFDALKDDNFLKFRVNIDNVEKYNDPMIIEKKLEAYYDELINGYDYENEIFKYYNDILNNPSLLIGNNRQDFIFDFDVRMLFSSYRDYDENNNYCFFDRSELSDKLKSITSKKLSEVIVDALFSDNIYNVWLNINEMLRYNNNLPPNKRVIDDKRVEFSKMIFDFDKISSREKIELYYKLKDKNINTIFYDDLRKLKDYAYDIIKEDLLDISSFKSNVNREYKDKYGIDVYDFRDVKYTMLVRAQYTYNDKSNNRRNCYSIISDENSVTYNTGNIIYGYNSFDNDKVIHMLEKDAFSVDVYNNEAVSRYVNRIMTSRELVNGSFWYSEVELVNLRDKDGKYDVKKPDYIVSYDQVRDIDIEESKRLNIPIVIIKNKSLEKEETINTLFDEKIDTYYNRGDRSKISR